MPASSPLPRAVAWALRPAGAARVRICVSGIAPGEAAALSGKVRRQGLHWTFVEPDARRAAALRRALGGRTDVLVVEADARRLLSAAAGTHAFPADAPLPSEQLPAHREAFDLVVLGGGLLEGLESEALAWLGLASRAARVAWVMHAAAAAAPPRGGLARMRAWFGKGESENTGRTSGEWRDLLRQSGARVLRIRDGGDGFLLAVGRGQAPPAKE
ncbi:MAG: hypothetical protein PWP23_2087 [Candidatus Sumerlaeota bacterium]|nr:hypothetical protein [Candidatus Sumerlaeota bacterium]